RVTGASRSGDDVHWTWNGYDPRLQTHTAGFRDYDVQYRVGTGTWSLIRDNTLSTSITLANRPGGRSYSIRVRATDRRGTVAAWTTGSRIGVPSPPSHEAAPLRRRQPDQRPDPRVHRAHQATHAAGIGGSRTAGRGGRGGGPPRYGLAAAPAPDQPAP